MATVATTGAYNDLSGTPAPFDPGTLATVATTGAYSDLSGLPTLGTAAASGTGAFATAAQGTTADAALPKAGGTLSGDIDGNGNKVLFANVYPTTGDLPSASTYHGMFAHVHATGKGYFAHAGSWIELGNQTDLTSATTTANAALPKAGGAMTGAITTNSTFDGRDVAADGTKLDGIETFADVTDTANVTAAGALMDSEVTHLAQVKAFDSSDYATSAQGALADSAVQPNDSPAFGNITVTGTVDGRDVAADGTKLDGIEAGADVTDTANVTAAGALMDSEVTNLAQVKAFNSADYATAAQGTLAGSAVQPNDNPTFGNIAVTGTVDGRDIATNIPASLGTAGQVLTVNAGATAGEWADAAAGGGGGGPAFSAF
ncbi:hypothetical protein N8Z18_00030 [bacterium]|nr:hypothetical protein [bacterium]